MPDGSSHVRILAVAFAITFTLSCVSTAVAQSGRRVKNPTPAAVPLPEPTPPPAATPENPKPVLKLVLGMERPDGFTGISLNTYTGVLRSCAERLDEPLSVKVELAQHPMRRIEAINRAKTEKDAYVIWLQVRADEMSSNPTGTPNNAYIEYLVFAPTTAKLVTSGSTYPRRGVIASPRTTGVNGDRAFNEAARAAADKILAALQMHIPSHIYVRKDTPDDPLANLKRPTL
jgi:hypothetical protein